MNPLITAGFHHSTMVCADAARTAAFYAELLGIPLLQRVNGSDAEVTQLFFGRDGGAPGTLLTFLEQRDGARGRWGLGGIHHLALGVEDADAQLKWKRRLMDAGIGVVGPYNRGWFSSIYFSDPDGQILEIATRGPGYELDEPIDQLGQRVVIPNPSQLRGNRDEAAIEALTHPEPVQTITPDMSLLGIHHITGFTDDIIRADEFYHATLGLRLVKKSVNQDDPKTPHWFWACYDGTTVKPHSTLTFFEWKNSDYWARPGVGQTHHIAFQAGSPAEQRAWQEHLSGLGVHAVRVERAGWSSLRFRAPDGLLLEITVEAKA